MMQHQSFPQVTGSYTATPTVTSNGAYVVSGCTFTSATASINSPMMNFSSGSAKISMPGPKAVIEVDGGTIDLNMLATMMKHMQDILCLVRDNAELHENYPALKDIYDQYRVVETMVRSEDQ